MPLHLSAMVRSAAPAGKVTHSWKHEAIVPARNKLTQCFSSPVPFYPGGPLLFDPLPEIMAEAIVHEHLARQILPDPGIGEIGAAVRHIGDEGDEDIIRRK